jgi:alpha-glucosidase (family GH31 glycosyl hydrolase)
MPFDATGFIQCKNRYRNQTQLLDVAHGYVDRNLPISIIVIDWSAWGRGGRCRSPAVFSFVLISLPPSPQCTMLLKVRKE